MAEVFNWWVISAIVLIVAAAVIGKVVNDTFFGIFIDRNKRVSLSQFQLTLWTILVLSLLSGVFIARLTNPNTASKALNITIPNELLIVMGISVGSLATSSAIKASKVSRGVNFIGNGHPNFFQLFTV